jgi:hypothetical protein
MLKGATIHVGMPWFLVGPLLMEGLPAAGLGSDSMTYSIPLSPNLLGTKIYLQSLILDPGASQGLAATAGAELIIGE